MLSSLYIRCRRSFGVFLFACLGFSLHASGQTNLFDQGYTAYAAGNYAGAAKAFDAETRRSPSAESWQNLGNAQWQEGQHGLAVLAWERARWINPFDKEAAASLDFARHSASLTGPVLRWWELFSTLLPPDAWPWLAMASFWLTISTVVIFPVTLRWRRSAWSQPLAAIGLGIFLLALTGVVGVQTRSWMAAVVSPIAILRQAPANHAQMVSRPAAGESVRVDLARGNYLHVHTSSGDSGWLARNELEFVVRRSGIQDSSAGRSGL